MMIENTTIMANTMTDGMTPTSWIMCGLMVLAFGIYLAIILWAYQFSPAAKNKIEREERDYREAIAKRDAVSEAYWAGRSRKQDEIKEAKYQKKLAEIRLETRKLDSQYNRVV